MDIYIIILSFILPLSTVLIMYIIDYLDKEEESLDSSSYIKMFVVNFIVSFFGLFLILNKYNNSGFGDMNVDVGLF